MTTFLLVRHATCDPVGHRLAGRAPGITLNAEGREQAVRLAAWLSPVAIDAVYSSPLERTTETAGYVAAPRGLAVVPHDAFVELDFGAWTGREIESLDGETDWKQFNAFRSGVGPPGGELMVAAQTRAVAALLSLATRHAAQTVVVVSHADVLRATLCYFAGVPLDFLLRLDIAPASVSAVAIDDWGPRLLTVNATGTPPGTALR